MCEAQKQKLSGIFQDVQYGWPGAWRMRDKTETTKEKRGQMKGFGVIYN